MGINATNLKNIERKIREYNENLTLFEQQFIIIPYLASGYIDYSNFGQVDGQYQINNFETYKRVWTGNDSFIITWKDSVEFTIDVESEKIQKNFKIGDYLLGWLENNSSNNDIATDQSFDYYKSQSSEQSLTFRINASRFKLNTNWEFMFFKVPEYSNDILYRVESVDREYVGIDLMCYVLRLKALNQDLANTGQAKQQNVMPNSPGQGYYAPLIVNDYQPQKTDVYGTHYIKIDNRYIIYDKNKTLNNPVKKVVLKAFGLCIFSNIAIWGRRVLYGSDFRDFGIPRWIFPINITNASTQTIYRVQSSESNYYWISNAQPTIVFNKETFDALKSFLKTDAVWSGQGFLGVDISQTKNTNPSTDGVSYTYQLYGDNQLQKGKIVNVPWTITLSSKTYRTDTIYGCEQYYKVEGDKKIHDAMFDAFWTQKNMVALPISPRNTISFGWTLGATYAAAVARNFMTAFAIMLIGITGTIINKVVKPNFQGFSGIIPASIFDFMVSETNGIYADKAAQQVRLSYFENYDQENDINKFFNTQTINTSFQADLTDKIASDRLTYVGNETTCIGQTQWDTGVNVCKDGSTFLLNGDATLVELSADEKDVGFIVDAFNIQAMFMGDYSIEFLDKDDTVIWSGVYQSQGKWTGSVREINTWINTSIYGRENMFISQPLSWPKEIPDLNLIGYQKPATISQEFKELERGFRTNYPNEYRDNTYREILQNQNFLGLEWKYNENYFYHCANTNEQSSFVYNDKFVLNSFWGLELQDWLNTYKNISLEFDGFILTPSSTKTSLSFNLGNYNIQDNKITLKQTISFNASGKLDDYFYKSTGGTNPSPELNYHVWLSNPFGKGYYDVELTITKENSQIIMYVKATLGKTIALSIQVWQDTRTAKTVIKNWVDVDSWLGKTANNLDESYVAIPKVKDINSFVGVFVRKINVSPYYVPEDTQEE